MDVHAYKSQHSGAEAGGRPLASSRPAWASQQDPGSYYVTQAVLKPWAQDILLPQPPKELGLSVPVTTPSFLLLLMTGTIKEALYLRDRVQGQLTLLSTQQCPAQKGLVSFLHMTDLVSRGK